MDSETVSRGDILAAMSRFDEEQRPDFEWTDQYTYEVVHEGHRYPLKLVRSLATGEALTEFRGDERLRRWYSDRGFEVRHRSEMSLQYGFEAVLQDYLETRKTRVFSSDAGVAQVLARLQRLLAASDPVRRRPHLRVVASWGKGNWAQVPWISLLDTRVTTSTQRGVYPVYLFNAEMDAVYATLNQGTTDLKKQHGGRRAKQLFTDMARRIRPLVSDLLDGFTLNNDVDLASQSQLGRDYEVATIAHRRYTAGDVPADDELLRDLEHLLDAYDRYYARRLELEDEEASRDAIPSSPRAESDKDPIRLLADELLVSPAWVRKVLALWRRKRHMIFYGPPGTGKTYIARRLAQHLAEDPDHRAIVQFHPSYAYEDFVQGFRPAKDGTGFTLRDGPLVELAERARESDGPVCLFIDEINRGNIAKIFGELYFLLEYRGEEVRLQYDDEPFTLPENLYLIGTMNTADRSIALIDAALRRRFNFFPMFPDREPIEGILRRWLERHRPEMASVAEIVDLANAKMDDRNLLLGPSHFMQHDLDEALFELTWQHSVLPYLEEQFIDEPEQLEEFDLGLLREEVAAGDYVPARL